MDNDVLRVGDVDMSLESIRRAMEPPQDVRIAATVLALVSEVQRLRAIEGAVAAIAHAGALATKSEWECLVAIRRLTLSAFPKSSNHSEMTRKVHEALSLASALQERKINGACKECGHGKSSHYVAGAVSMCDDCYACTFAEMR